MNTTPSYTNQSLSMQTTNGAWPGSWNAFEAYETALDTREKTLEFLDTHMKGVEMVAVKAIIQCRTSNLSRGEAAPERCTSRGHLMLIATSVTEQG